MIEIMRLFKHANLSYNYFIRFIYNYLIILICWKDFLKIVQQNKHIIDYYADILIMPLKLNNHVYFRSCIRLPSVSFGG